MLANLPAPWSIGDRVACIGLHSQKFFHLDLRIPGQPGLRLGDIIATLALMFQGSVMLQGSPKHVAIESA